LPPPTSTLLPYTTLFRSPRLGISDELLQRLGRHVSGRDDCDVRQFVGQRRRDQILLGVERHFRDQELVDREMSDRRSAERVAIQDRKSTRLNSSHSQISY